MPRGTTCSAGVRTREENSCRPERQRPTASGRMRAGASGSRVSKPVTERCRTTGLAVPRDDVQSRSRSPTPTGTSRADVLAGLMPSTSNTPTLTAELALLATPCVGYRLTCRGSSMDSSCWSSLGRAVAFALGWRLAAGDRNPLGDSTACAADQAKYRTRDVPRHTGKRRCVPVSFNVTRA